MIVCRYTRQKKPDVAYPTMDGDDVVCSNCGYIIGWGDEESDPVCPSCGARLNWSEK
jgi:rubrerythrin